MSIVILIVEDDLTNLKLTKDILQAEGYVTIEATDGKQGMELAKAQKPALVLMDIGLPVTNGIEATKILKADAATRHIPIIALTAYAMKEDAEKVLKVGCDGYLSKPFEIELLLKKIAEHLPLKRRQSFQGRR